MGPQDNRYEMRSAIILQGNMTIYFVWLPCNCETLKVNTMLKIKRLGLREHFQLVRCLIDIKDSISSVSYRILTDLYLKTLLITAHAWASARYTWAVCKVLGLTLLLRVGTWWRCSDGLFFEVPPLASDALLTTLHPLLGNVPQTIDHFEISCLGAPF
jgi:hypothetical protein